jgi:Phosphatidylethanolamine-binding protein
MCPGLEEPHASLAFVSPVLNWLPTSFKPQPMVDGKPSFKSSEAHLIQYCGPQLPSWTDLHRYAFVLYKESASFSAQEYVPTGGKDLRWWKKRRYDLNAFENDTGLGSIVAVNITLYRK